MKICENVFWKIYRLQDSTWQVRRLTAVYHTEERKLSNLELSIKMYQITVCFLIIVLTHGPVIFFFLLFKTEKQLLEIFPVTKFFSINLLLGLFELFVTFLVETQTM